MHKYYKTFINMCLNKAKYGSRTDYINWDEVFGYAIKKCMNIRLKTHANFLDTYKIIDENTASILYNNKEVFLPKSTNLKKLRTTMKEFLDKSHWYQYETEFTPLSKEDIVLDCTPSEGFWAVTVMDKIKKIYLIEPRKDYYYHLKKTFEKNTEQIELINCVIGSKDNKYVLSKHDNIEVYKLDTLIQNTQITFLKADIKDSKIELLKGAKETIKKYRPKIALKVYHPEHNRQNIQNYLQGLVPEYKFNYKNPISKGTILMLHAKVMN